MGLEIKYNGKNPKQLKKAFETMMPGLMIEVANEVVNFVADNFKNQSFDTGDGFDKWPARSENSPPNDRPLLVNRTHLKNGIRKDINGNEVTISVAPPADKYAAVHNEGFDGEVTVKAFTRKNKKGDRFEGKGKSKQKTASGIALVKSFTRHMHIPKRQFVGDSKALTRKVKAAIDTAIENVFK